MKRYWHRRDARLTFATSTTDPHAACLRAHSDAARTRNVARSKATADPMTAHWLHRSTRQGRHPHASAKTGQVAGKSNTGAVAMVGCSSNMTTGSRWIISMGTTAIRALPTCKRSMDTATMRKRGSKGTTSRQVCVTSIRILRSGVRGNAARAVLERPQAERSAYRL